MILSINIHTTFLLLITIVMPIHVIQAIVLLDDSSADECILSPWSVWSHCSQSCNVGRKRRTRSDTPGTRVCKPLATETALCSIDPCPTSPACSDSASWTVWSKCPKDRCGVGISKRIRTNDNFVQLNLTHFCGGEVQEEVCSGPPCYPKQFFVDVVCGELKEALNGDVSVREVAGRIAKRLTIFTRIHNWFILTLYSPGNAGIKATAAFSTIANYPTEVFCKEFGTKIFFRPVHDEITEAPKEVKQRLSYQNGSITLRSLGGPCQTLETFTKEEPSVELTFTNTNQKLYLSCNASAFLSIRRRPTKQKPKNIDCDFSVWSAWTNCSVRCGENGLRSRNRKITRALTGDGLPCPHLQESTACFSTCPTTSVEVECKMSDWLPWSACTAANCGADGVRGRLRVVLVEAANCPHMAEEQRCRNTLASCPINCQVSVWSHWSHCSATCGFAQQSRSRTVIIKPQTDGKQCPLLQEDRECMLEKCPTPCLVTPWSDWSCCSGSTHSAARVRSRTITVSQTGEERCPELEEYTSCTAVTCPSDCTVNNWQAWTRCSVSCGSEGRTSRKRTIKSAPIAGGKACPKLTEQTECNTNIICPSDCQMSAWSYWSPCSISCYSKVSDRGEFSRTRRIIRPATGGGKPCGKQTEQKECKALQACSITSDCVVGNWGTWSVCSVSCGLGSRSRRRAITITSQGDGNFCPILQETSHCADLILCQLNPRNQPKKNRQDGNSLHHLGCFRANNLRCIRTADNSPLKCSRRCAHIFALRGDQCCCSQGGRKSIERLQEATGACQRRCAGDYSSTCGGHYRHTFDFYENLHINLDFHLKRFRMRSWKQRGCFLEGKDGRCHQLTGKNAPDACAKMCRNVFAVHADTCCCYDSLDAATRHGMILGRGRRSLCNLRCGGDTVAKCGGYQRTKRLYNVYEKNL